MNRYGLGSSPRSLTYSWIACCADWARKVVRINVEINLYINKKRPYKKRVKKEENSCKKQINKINIENLNKTGSTVTFKSKCLENCKINEYLSRKKCIF